MRKEGFTLVEMLGVVAIMGILAGIGVASLRGAIANSRIKDAGINVTAFMERAANEAVRLNQKLCLEADDQSMKLYKNECAETKGALIDEMKLESLNQFVTTGKNCPDVGVAGETNTPASTMTLTPKIGVSAIPAGCFMVRYGSSDRYAASIKISTKFGAYYKLSYDSGTSWSEM